MLLAVANLLLSTVLYFTIYFIFYTSICAALVVGRSRDLFPVLSLGFFFRGSRRNHVPWGRLSLWKWVPGISPGVKAADAFHWRPTNLVVLKVAKIRGLNLPGIPWATSALAGYHYFFYSHWVLLHTLLIPFRRTFFRTKFTALQVDYAVWFVTSCRPVLIINTGYTQKNGAVSKVNLTGCYPNWTPIMTITFYNWTVLPPHFHRNVRVLIPFPQKETTNFTLGHPVRRI